MLKTVSFGIAALAAAGFATSAMAATTQSANVSVKITVDKIVSVWSDDSQINLLMDGSDPGANNLALAPSHIKYINNTDAKIDVTVAGSLPGASSGGDGIKFFIFNHNNEAQAKAAIAANAYGPANALAWNGSTVSGSGSTQNLVASTGVHQTAVTMPILYASDSPGDVPTSGDYNLTVTYTITANSP